MLTLPSPSLPGDLVITLLLLQDLSLIPDMAWLTYLHLGCNHPVLPPEAGFVPSSLHVPFAPGWDFYPRMFNDMPVLLVQTDGSFRKEMTCVTG